METIDEKKLLEMEKLKQDLSLDLKRFDVELKRFDVELSKKSYEAWRLAFYGIAVGAGGTFAIAKTLQFLGV